MSCKTLLKSGDIPLKVLTVNISVCFADDFDTCGYNTKLVHTVSGAVITAHTAQTETLPINCTTIFRVRIVLTEQMVGNVFACL